MPFLRETFTSGDIHAGIWKITETVEELLSIVQISGAEKTIYSSFRQELRKTQWLAYRALIKHMLHPDSAEISYDVNRKPFLASGSHFISVSHAGEFAAAICAKNSPVGIDIEHLTNRVERVKERFMLPAELESLGPESRIEQLYIYWCGKEALYKLNGKPGLDFRNDIYIHPFDYLCNTNRICSATLHVDGNQKDYTLKYEKLDDYLVVVAY